MQFNPIKVFGILLALASSGSVRAQSYSEFQRITKQLTSHDSLQVEAAWRELKVNNRIPLVENDSVAFLFRGKAHSVKWMGDFNGWGSNRKINVSGKKISPDIWMLKMAFPTDGRFDYKIVLNDTDWQLDAHNPLQQWSGVGGGSPNSELRMPQFKPDAAHQVTVAVAGKISDDILFTSQNLNYQLTYKVYTPPGYESLTNLPVLYVTDGYEYLHPKMGNMAAVLDYLIDTKKIAPLVAIFVDHREPINRANNRRMEELGINSKFLTFFCDELVPTVEESLKTVKSPQKRGILGTSMGGLNATYFAFTRPDVFGLAGVQSPSFYMKPIIYEMCNTPESPKIKVSMTSGTVHDASDGTRRMKTILEKNACVFTYREVNEGHSWGNWKNLIDDILIDLFGI